MVHAAARRRIACVCAMPGICCSKFGCRMLLIFELCISRPRSRGAVISRETHGYSDTFRILH
eukprot:2269829-Prymnesium_polylepis.1